VPQFAQTFESRGIPTPQFAQAISSGIDLVVD
jgi:hypothetical protein